MFEGILIEDRRDAGSQHITSFAIRPGQESAAARELLACLADGAEVSLRNDMDEGGEGASSFCRSASGFFTRVGGHGCQSEWKPVDEAAFLAAVVELACHNRGGPQAHGSITQGMRLAIGPFDPPEDYAFEPEFAAPPPRSITPRVRLSGIERRQIWAIRGTIAFGIVMLLLDQVARAEDWMRAVPPLVYLRWVAYDFLTRYRSARVRW